MPVVHKRTSQRKSLNTTLYTFVALASVFYIGRLSTSSSPAKTGDVASSQEYRSEASTTSSTSATSNNLQYSIFNLNLRSDLPIEIWAQSQPHPEAADVRASLSNTELTNLKNLCGRTLYHGLQNVVVAHDNGQSSFFATGDLPLMWIRDSAFQIGVLLPKVKSRPSLRLVIEGGIRQQAFYILQDPYANGFYPEWRDPNEENEEDRSLGRGGWVGVRNYELDSGAYFLNLLWNYAQTPGIYRPEVLLSDPMIYDAVVLMVRTWVIEQRHNATTSPYRFVELEKDGLGNPVGYTGMIWSGFRPSDDENGYGYSIPSNMYAAGALQRALELNRGVWQSAEFEQMASKLLKEVIAGMEKFGIVDSTDKILDVAILNGNSEEKVILSTEDLPAEAASVPGPKVYAYEVDGLGNAIADFDDPNWPSLVSMPLLGYAGYDAAVYATTRNRLLSTKNEYWFEGKGFRGMGSPHTSHGMAWALGTLSEALTATTAEDRAEKLRLLLKLQCGDGLMHESIHVDKLDRCTRKWFEWANALSVVAIEHLVGADCDAAAEVHHRAVIAQREKYRGKNRFMALFHQGIESAVQWGGKYNSSKVNVWKGIGWTI